MRITIAGARYQGKTTTAGGFCSFWKNYTVNPKTFDSKCKVTAKDLLDNFNKAITDINNTKKGDNVIFDESPFDIFVTALWSYAKANSDITKEVINEMVSKLQEAMRSIDIIFLSPRSKLTDTKLPEDIDLNEATSIEEKDNIYKAISYNLMQKGTCQFFDDNDRPPIIEIFGTPEQQLEIIRLYIGDDGNPIDNVASVFSNENLDLMEKLLQEQNEASYNEKMEQQFKTGIILDKDHSNEAGKINSKNTRKDRN